MWLESSILRFPSVHLETSGYGENGENGENGDNGENGEPSVNGENTENGQNDHDGTTGEIGEGREGEHAGTVRLALSFLPFRASSVAIKLGTHQRASRFERRYQAQVRYRVGMNLCDGA